MTSTLWKYFLRELVPNFFFGFAAFLFVFFMTQVLKISDLVVMHGVGVKDITRLITFVLLPFVGMTFPVALLFAVLISMGRMGQDSELVALRASGISLTQMLKPILFFSIVIMILSGVFTVFVESWGFRSFKKLVFDIGKSKISTGIQPGLFNEDFHNLVIYTDHIDRKNNFMNHILLFDERETERPLTVIAKSGKIMSDPENLLLTLRLFNGNILTSEKKSKAYRKIDFETYDFSLILTPEAEFSIGDPRAMSTPMLKKQIKMYEDRKITPVREIVELHRRFSVPLACVIFAIFSTGIAGLAKNPRFSPGKGKAVMISMSVIITYWLMGLWGQSFSGKGVMPPGIVMWIPNVFFMGFAILLFRYSKKKL